jgi:hypothetical protein
VERSVALFVALLPLVVVVVVKNKMVERKNAIAALVV